MFSVTATNDLNDLDTLTVALQQHGESEGLSDALTHRLLIVVEELFVNFVRHGAAVDGKFVVEVDRCAAGIDVCLTDEGIPFDPLSTPQTDTGAALEERDVGGLGLHLVRQFAQDLTYRRDDSRNVVEFRLCD